MLMSIQARTVVQVKRRFEETPEQVFDAWLDPDNAGRWLFATPTGEMVRVEIDARVGGRFSIVERRDGEDIAHTGQYIELSRPHRLVFDFAVKKFSDEVTRVKLESAPQGTGCELTLTHEGVYAEYAERTESGWRGILDGLAATLKGG